MRTYLANLYKAHSGQSDPLSSTQPFSNVPQILNDSNLSLIVLVSVLLFCAVIMLFHHAYCQKTDGDGESRPLDTEQVPIGNVEQTTATISVT